MKYLYSDEWTAVAREVALQLKLSHVKPDRICCIKSQGTKTHRTIARIHGLGKVMQLGLKSEPFYAIELISEKFDKQPHEEKMKTIIHELLHIPEAFGGGFRGHKYYVNRQTVDIAFEKLKKCTNLF